MTTDTHLMDAATGAPTLFDKLIRFAIDQRWLVLGMAALGVYNYQRLPIDAVPDITNVQVQVNTAAPGYSPLESEQRITFPIETAMAGLPDLEQTRSISRYGLSQVTVIFKDGTGIYFARQLVNERIQEAKDKLPPGIAPAMGPIASGLGEIYMWTVDSQPGALKPDGTPYTPTDLREIQDWIIKPQLRNVPGVTEINSIGGNAKAFQVAPDTTKLMAHGLSLGDVVAALERNNASVGAGYIERSGEQYLIRAPGQVGNLEDIANIVIGAPQGVPLRVGEVAEVMMAKELRTGAATENGREVVLGTVFMLLGENSRIVSQAVDQRMQQINKSLPAGVVAQTVYDRTVLVDRAIATVKTGAIRCSPSPSTRPAPLNSGSRPQHPTPRSRASSMRSNKRRAHGHRRKAFHHQAIVTRSGCVAQGAGHHPGDVDWR